MIRSYIAANRTRFMEEWASLIRIPSVSCQPAHKDDMLRCAERWRELLLAAGAQHAEVMPSAGNPFVYAEYSPMEVKGERLEVKGMEFTPYDIVYAPAYEGAALWRIVREGDKVITPPSLAEGPAKVAFVYAAPLLE